MFLEHFWVSIFTNGSITKIFVLSYLKLATLNSHNNSHNSYNKRLNQYSILNHPIHPKSKRKFFKKLYLTHRMLLASFYILGIHKKTEFF